MIQATSRRTLTPRYGFLLTRLRGNPVEVHGLRHGTIPFSSILIIFSVTMPYTSIVVVSELILTVKERAAFTALSRLDEFRRGCRRPLPLSARCSRDCRASASEALRSRYGCA